MKQVGDDILEFLRVATAKLAEVPLHDVADQLADSSPLEGQMQVA